MPIFNIITIQVILPLFLVSWLWGRPQPSRANWLVQAVAAGAFVAFALTVGNWGWTSIYLGGGLLLLYLAALVRSFQRAPTRWRPSRLGKGWREKLFTGVNLFIAAVFVPLVAYAFSGYAVAEEPIHLRFPLRSGVYYIGQGGSHPLINYHNVNAKQRYALDVVKLNALGVRAEGFYPAQLRRYVIYGDMLHSPCRGVVEEVVSNLPDHNPPSKDIRHPAGNHIVFECGGTRVFLAHMMKGSALVEKGEGIEAGEPVGRVGNSGNTSEPHLHIHAERNGEGVPIRFGGRFLVRNSLVWR